MGRERIALSFSSGKDSVMALHRLLFDLADEYEVVLLMTTANETFERSSIHGVRAELLRAQAEAICLPLKVVWLPNPCPSEKYQEVMAKACDELKARDIEAVAFGDIFLEDVRQYREEMLAKAGMRAIFPLWGKNPDDIVNEFIDLGYKAKITCVDLTRLDQNFSGRELDRQFLADLPQEVDVCGENGEYHSFVYDGPVFAWPIDVAAGEKRMTEDVYSGQIRFCFTDFIFQVKDNE